MNEPEQRFDADVIILGAGMAGLTAARALAEKNLRVVVLEARDRIGGRLFSHEIAEGQVIELGAEFVHGRAKELWSLIDEAGCETVERDGAMLREVSPGVLERDDDEEDELFQPLETLKACRSEGTPDQPFAEWLAQSDVPDWQRAALTGYVEGFNAADAHRIGIHALGMQQKAEDAIDGDRAWHITGGYHQLALYLAGKVLENGGDLRLSCAATEIRWRRNFIEVRTHDNSIVRARRCVVTLPLGVLQQINRTNGIRIEPEPQAITHAQRLAMGHVSRFTLVFREAWWHNSRALQPPDEKSLRTMSFLFTLRGTPSVWWTPHPESEQLPTLTGWAGGPRAEALLSRSAEELGRDAYAALAKVFGMEETIVRNALIETHTHNWSTDPWARGAYSYVPAGALDAPQKMSGPEANTLFFAGEHTDTTGHWGTVHAAIRSGLRAAEQVLAATATKQD